MGNLCLNQCHIFKLASDEGKILVSPNDFVLVGQSLVEQKQVCATKLQVNGEILIVEINDILGTETVISLRSGSKLVASSSFSGAAGTMSVYAKSIRISCTRNP